jgi:hypothetical protein
MNLTSKHLDTLRHMLGINTPTTPRPEPYRNYAAVNPGDPEYLELTALGAIELYGRQGSLDYYRCTAAGKLAAMRSHRMIRLSKRKRVYSKFLDVRDALGDISFKDFITLPAYKQSRDSA